MTRDEGCVGDLDFGFDMGCDGWWVTRDEGCVGDSDFGFDMEALLITRGGICEGLSAWDTELRVGTAVVLDEGAGLASVFEATPGVFGGNPSGPEPGFLL